MLLVPQISIDEVAALAAALEANSEHPLAAAIVAFAAARLGRAPAPSPGKAGLEPRMSDGGGAARRVDWVRPAQDVQVMIACSFLPRSEITRDTLQFQIPTAHVQSTSNQPSRK